MILNYGIENKLKGISIRGRFAFGVKCLEKYIEQNKISNKWTEKLFDTLWEFTHSSRLDLWHDKINDLDPWNLLDPNSGIPSDYKTLKEDEFYELKDFYNSLNKNFVDMIGCTIEIGTGNLYGGTGRYSQASLNPTIELVKIAKKELIELPNIKAFMFTKFSEDDGWGNHFEKNQIS